jgi:hypothetical protein
MAQHAQSIALPPLVYLDNSVLGRLSDTAPAVAAEALAAAQIAAAVAAGRLRLLNSEILAAEVAAGPLYVRTRSEAVLQYATASVSIVETLPLADRLHGLRLPLRDTLHLAAAGTGGAWYAVSCDQSHWLSVATQIATRLGPRPAILSPAELVIREGL